MSVKDQKVSEIVHILSTGSPVEKDIAEIEHKNPWIIFTFKKADTITQYLKYLTSFLFLFMIS